MITAHLDALEQAFSQVQSARSEVTTRTATQENAEAKLDQMLTQLAGYVESVAGKDATLITSVGMETKASRSTPTLPSVPQALSAVAGDHDVVVPRLIDQLAWALRLAGRGAP